MRSFVLVLLLLVVLFVVCAESRRSVSRSRTGSRGRTSGHSHRTSGRHKNKHESLSEEKKPVLEENAKKHSAKKFLKHERKQGSEGKSNRTRHSGRHGHSEGNSRNKMESDRKKHLHGHNSSYHNIKLNASHNHGWNSAGGQNSSHGNYGWNTANNSTDYGWNFKIPHNSSRGLGGFHGQNNTRKYGWKADDQPGTGLQAPGNNLNQSDSSKSYYSRQFFSSPISNVSDGFPFVSQQLGTTQDQIYTKIGWNAGGHESGQPIVAPTYRAAAASSFFSPVVQSDLNSDTRTQFQHYGQTAKNYHKSKDKTKKKKIFDMSIEDFSIEDFSFDKSDLRDVMEATGKKLRGKLKSHSTDKTTLKLPTRRIYSTKFPKYNRGFDLKPFSFNGSLQNFTNTSKIAYFDRRNKRDLSDDEMKLVRVINDFMSKESAWNEARIREKRDVKGIVIAEDNMKDKTNGNFADNSKFDEIEALVGDQFDMTVFAKLRKDRKERPEEKTESTEQRRSEHEYVLTSDYDKNKHGTSVLDKDKQHKTEFQSSRKITRLFRVPETIEQFLKRRLLGIKNQTEDHWKEFTEEGYTSTTDAGATETAMRFDGNASANGFSENHSGFSNSIIVPLKADSTEEVEDGFERTNVNVTTIVDSTTTIDSMRRTTIAITNENINNKPHEAKPRIVLSEPTIGLGSSAVGYSLSTVKTPGEVSNRRWKSSEEITDDSTDNQRTARPMFGFSIVSVHKQQAYRLPRIRTRKRNQGPSDGRILVGEVLIAAPRKTIRCPRGWRSLRGRCRAVWGSSGYYI